MSDTTKRADDKRRADFLRKHPDAHTVWVRGEPTATYPTKGQALAAAKWERERMHEFGVRVERFVP